MPIIAVIISWIPSGIDTELVNIPATAPITVTIPVMRIGEICITEKDIWQRGFAVFQIEWVVSETGLNWWNYLNSDLVFIVANINSPYDYIFRSPCWYVRR